MEILGIITHGLALLLLIVDVRAAVVPLAGFMLACIFAPFFPRFGFFLPSISRRRTRQKVIALTFDDGPDHPSTRALLNLLAKYGMPATFFVTGLKAARYPDLIKEILAHGHTVGNHTYSHDLMLMFKRRAAIRHEITSAQAVFDRFGFRALAFRPPAGITNPLLGQVLAELDIYNVNFSCRAIDFGNRWLSRLSRRILKRVKPGDIVMLHDSVPANTSQLDSWLKEVEEILAGLRSREYQILPLNELIDRPVMIPVRTDR